MTPRKVAWAIIKTIFGIVVAAAIMMLVYRFALDAYDFGYRIFAEEPVSPEPGLTMSVAIVEGKSVMEIGQILEEKGLIRNAFLFYVQELFSSYHDDMKPGVYELNTAMTPEEMMAAMSESTTSVEETEEEISGNSDASSEMIESGTENGAETTETGTTETGMTETGTTETPDAAETVTQP